MEITGAGRAVHDFLPIVTNPVIRLAGSMGPIFLPLWIPYEVNGSTSTLQQIPM
jgi:hypothetical protein